MVPNPNSNCAECCLCGLYALHPAVEYMPCSYHSGACEAREYRPHAGFLRPRVTSRVPPAGLHIRRGPSHAMPPVAPALGLRRDVMSQAMPRSQSSIS